MAQESSQTNRLDQSVIDALFSLYRNRDYVTLSRRIQSLLDDHPRELVLHSLLGAAYLELGEYEAAMDSYHAALAIKPDFEKIHNSLGITHLRLQQYDEAAAAFKNAVDINPRFAPAWFNLGIVYENCNQWREAAESYRKAIEFNSDYVEAFNALGTVLWELGEHERVAEQYEKALALRRDYYPAWRNLLHFLEKSNRSDELKNALNQAGRVLGDHALIRFYEGVVADMEGDYASARSGLESTSFDANDPLGRHDERLRLARLIGICDRLNETDAAIQYAREANALSQQISAGKGISKATFLNTVKDRRDYFVPENLSHWPAASGSDTEEPAPVFIIGFPRSGTTLLDTILRSHPGIRVAEECDAVPVLIERLASESGNHLDQLPHLSLDTIRNLRKIYLDRLGNHLQPDDDSPRLIDRFAFNIIYAGEIHRVFPEARFILVLRHPADCVLSCYLQTFYETSANANFHTLEDAVALYDQVFGLWQQFENNLGLNVLHIHYEDLVADIEQACGPVLDFIDRPWHPAMLDYQETARNRDVIRTASYNQVTRPLYTRAAGRWRRYRAALEPVLPVLEPWARRFGYTMGEA